jgi:hypothetical protein
VLTRYIASDAHTRGGELPGKTFTATPGFIDEQTDDGVLTHEFEIAGKRGRRMVIPYQIWMLQRIEAVLTTCRASRAGRDAVDELLGHFERGPELLQLEEILAGCRVRKERALLFSA